MFLFEFLFCLRNDLNMEVVRKCEVILEKNAEPFCVKVCNYV
jgi:hypothetical protein